MTTGYWILSTLPNLQFLLLLLFTKFRLELHHRFLNENLYAIKLQTLIISGMQKSHIQAPLCELPIGDHRWRSMIKCQIIWFQSSIESELAQAKLNRSKSRDQPKFRWWLRTHFEHYVMIFLKMNFPYHSKQVFK